MKRLAAILLVAFTAACTKDNLGDCFHGNRDIITETRFTAPFDRLQVNDKMEVTVSRGNEYKVEITFPKKLLRNVSAKVTDGELRLFDNNTCNFVRGYHHMLKVRVTAPYYKLITHFSVGPVRFEPGFTQDTLVVRAESSGDFHVNGVFNELRTSSHGNGDMYVSGSCNTFYVYANGTNYVYGSDLQVRDKIFIQTLTFGDCYVSAGHLDRLEYNIGSEGDIFYAGQPATIVDYSSGNAKGRAIRTD